MQREFLQEKSLNRSIDNAEKSLNVDLSAKSHLLPHSTASNMLGLNDLYIEERDACDCYRMVFTVNSVCSNILYNAITEPVYAEGSLSAMSLVQSSITRDDPIFPLGTINQSANTEGQRIVDRIAAVRDTEYTHEKIGDFVYHCGYDIFNNHLLRTNDFEHVTMGKKKENEDVFNTIFDYAIGYDGKPVERIVGENEGPLTSLAKTKIRMYSLDTIKTMNTAFYDNLRLVDGWYGFYNSGYINIPNAELKGKDININRILNNETRCEFINLYPDRTLFNFIPKVNRYKKRIERNWDCSIVYPYKNDKEKFNELNENSVNAIKIIGTRVVYNNVGDEMIEMFSLLRHNLSPGDNIRIFYEGTDTGGTVLTRFSVPVMVASVGKTDGTEEDRYFTIKLSSVNTFCDVMEGENDDKTLCIRGTETRDETTGDIISGEGIRFFFKKIENGYDVRYYFRKFKHIKNAYSVINGSKTENVSKPLSYTQNKIAFATNIYGDRTAQVIFNDDICVSGLKDNLGRPLTTVYFTVIKTNRGHKEWYEEGIFSGDSIEYSHCFGDVTSGLDLPWDLSSTEYNVRKLYNVFKDELPESEREKYSEGLEEILYEAPKGPYSGTPSPLESGITIDADEFYGDIVQFDKVSYVETVIEKVYHRFNTAQRECLLNSKYFDINYDELVGDIYDVEELNDPSI